MSSNILILIARCFVILLLVFATAFPQTPDSESVENPVVFEVLVSTDSVSIGDEFTVLIKANYPEDIELSEPSIKSTENTFALKSDPSVKTNIQKNRKFDEYTFVLSAFDTGEQEIPAFEFFWYDDQGNQNLATPPSAKIYVISMMPADTAGLDIKDIVGPQPLPRRWWIYGIIALVVAIVSLVIYLLYRRKMKDVQVPEAPLEPPYDIAIRSLVQLKDKNLPARGKIKTYYIELSNIFRYYIQGRFDIIAVEATTFELKRQLKHPELSRDETMATLDFLSRSDMVKFAKHLPLSDVIERDYDTVKDIIVSTKPIEKPVDEQVEMAETAQ